MMIDPYEHLIDREREMNEVEEGERFDLRVEYVRWDRK